MEMVLLVILYGLDVIKYWIGNKLFFEGKMRWPWLAAAGGAGLFIWLNVFSVTGAEGRVFVGLAAILTAEIMAVENLKIKTIRSIWLYAIVSFLDGASGILFKQIIESEKAINFACSFFSLMGISISGWIFNKIQKMYSNKRHLFTILHIIVIFVCLSVGISVSAIQFMFETLPKEMELINLNYIMLISFIALFLLAILMCYIQKLYELLEQVADTERNLKQIQTTYYQSLLDKEEETRKYRHDMYNHLLAIGELAKTENAQQTADYINRLGVKWKEVSGNQKETGNMILNILLHHYLHGLKGVKISIIGFCTRELKIDTIDFCTIFSNLIQNAAEELNRQSIREKYFTLKINSGTETIRFIICNSTNLSLNEQNQRLPSSKGDEKNHGIGLGNVKAVVEKYGGELIWSADGKEFKVVVTMNI